FGSTKSGEADDHVIPAEPEQTEARYLVHHADVPLNIIYKAWHMCARMDKDYFATDLLSDLLSGGKSGRLYQSLVKEKKLFSELNAYQTGSIDPGLLVIEGRLVKGVDMKVGEKSILEELDKIISKKIDEEELTKVKNRLEAH